jgi:small multidrug resistance family-3 protein
MRAAALFVVAALAEIGGAFLVWRAVRGGAAPWLGIAGVMALGAYGVVASLQADPHFGRVLAAYGGVFICASLLWGVLADGFRPRLADFVGAGLCLAGAAVIMNG